jgi:hypothetical protein
MLTQVVCCGIDYKKFFFLQSETDVNQLIMKMPNLKWHKGIGGARKLLGENLGEVFNSRSGCA